MFQIEILANSIAGKLSSELSLDGERKEVIAYGAFALIQTVLSIILVIIFGLLFKVTLEALLISFVVSILRKYSGGIHASTSDACTIIGTVIFVGLAKIISLTGPLISLEVVLGLLIISFLWDYYIILKLAPVESSKKQLSEQKKKRMRKSSIIILSIYLMLALLACVIYRVTGEKKLLVYCLCICIGSIWQMFTLTKVGHMALRKVDTLLNHILTLKGGK
jgi:accessory gene regulator B